MGTDIFSEIEITDQGALRQTYALLQKEAFYWECGRGGCDYKLDQGVNPEIWENLSVNGIEVQADRYLFCKNWLPLDRETVEEAHHSYIYEGETTRPLLVEKHESKAYGYHAVSSGEQITVIGNAVNGKLEAFTVSGKDEPAILIGDNIESMVTREKESRTAYIIVSLLVLLLLSPVMIGRCRLLKERKK